MFTIFQTQLNTGFYINDFFFLTENTDVCNYAEDTTFYVFDSDL